MFLTGTVAANENMGDGCKGLQLFGTASSISNPAMSQLTGFGRHLDHQVWILSNISGG
jgi:hypothetical protein